MSSITPQQSVDMADAATTESSPESCLSGSTLTLVSPEVEMPRTNRDAEENCLPQISPPVNHTSAPMMALNDELLFSEANKKTHLANFINATQHNSSDYIEDFSSASMSTSSSSSSLLPTTDRSNSSSTTKSLSTYLEYSYSPANMSTEYNNHSHLTTGGVTSASKRAISRNLNVSSFGGGVTGQTSYMPTIEVKNPLLNPLLAHLYSNSTSTPSNMKVISGGFATAANFAPVDRAKWTEDEEELPIQLMPGTKRMLFFFTRKLQYCNGINHI